MTDRLICINVLVDNNLRRDSLLPMNDNRLKGENTTVQVYSQ